jgi:acyl-CoA reductase-like NAD-dependent aldehyde dehydrogenase
MTSPEPGTVIPLAGTGTVIDGWLAAAQRAQADWALRPVTARLALVARFRDRLAANAALLAAAIDRRPAAESLSGEILPLLAACRYLERNAAQLLGTRRHGGVGAWLHGIRVEVKREAFGTVLIVAPSNYGLMLPGIQALQALVAGNAVIIKPAPGARAALLGLAELLSQSGLPEGLLTVTDESVDTAGALIRARVDKVIVTGSVRAGRSVIADATESLVPVTAELSGWDACVVLESADLDRVARAIAFAITFNNGETCLAPRRILVQRAQRDALLGRLEAALSTAGPRPFRGTAESAAIELAGDAVRRGARLVTGALAADGAEGPMLLAGVTDRMAIFDSEVFGPIALVVDCASLDEAVAKANATRYALGASIFGEPAEARRVATRIDAGVVMINDAVAPAGHPAVPIAARRQSGSGATRGAEGLLELTRPKAIVTNAARRPAHLEPALIDAETFLGAYIAAAYRRSPIVRARAALAALGALLRSYRKQGNTSCL